MSAMRVAIVIICGIMAANSRADVMLFYALDADLKAFSEPCTRLGETLMVGSTGIQRLQLGSHRVLSVRMGSGSLETALHAQNIFSRFACSAAYSIGPAGALDPRLTLGSWHPVGTVVGWQVGSWGTAGFSLNPKATLRLDPSSCPLAEAAQPLHLASGDAFISSEAQAQAIHATSGATLIDMNLYGLARACQERSIPLHAWKIVSDRADANASIDFQRFVKSYAGDGGRILATWLMRQPLPPDQPEAHPRLNELLHPPE
jgi:adenosylhomocysteine nucleosidase